MSRRRTRRSLPVLVVLALAALSSAGTAGAQDGMGVRVVSNDAFSLTSSTLKSFVVFCVDQSNATRPCSLAATGSVRVSSALKRRYGLPSTTIAKGTLAPCGESECVKMLTTKAVRAKLKGVTRLPVTVRLPITSPVQETLSRPLTLLSRPTRRVVFQTANLGGDDAVPDGRG
jgi:hypothetical protein